MEALGTICMRDNLELHIGTGCPNNFDRLCRQVRQFGQADVQGKETIGVKIQPVKAQVRKVNFGAAQIERRGGGKLEG